MNAGASNNTIGGAAAGAGNVVSGNTQHAVTVVGNTSIGNIIQGNFIGTNPTGTAALANGGIGVDVVSAINTRIGGAGLARNVISGNGTGIQVRTNASGTIIQGNHSGTDAAGTAAIANAGGGISINDNVNGTTIGGAAVGQANVIAFNGGIGLAVQSGAGNIIVRNSIFSNGGLGIDLGATGITPNDTGDTDTGANNLLNFPVLTSATPNGAQTTVQGTFNSLPQVATFSIEIFGNTACDPSGNGEGQTFLAATNVTTDASGNATFSVTFRPRRRLYRDGDESSREHVGVLRMPERGRVADDLHGHQHERQRTGLAPTGDDSTPTKYRASTPSRSTFPATGPHTIALADRSCRTMLAATA